MIRQNLSGTGSNKSGEKDLVESIQPCFAHWTGSSSSKDKESTKRAA